MKKFGLRWVYAKSHRVDRMFDQLMPGEMRMRRVVGRERAEMDDVADTRCFRSVEQALGVDQHVDSVAGRKKNRIDALESGPEGLRAVVIEENGRMSPVPQPAGALVAPRGAQHLDGAALLLAGEKLHGRAADRPRGARHQNSSRHRGPLWILCVFG